MRDLDQQKALSIVCHASVFLSSAIVSIVIPIAILAASANPIVRRNAKESINFQISLFAYVIITIIAGFIGIMLFGLFVEDPIIHLNFPDSVALLIYGFALIIIAVAGFFFVLLWLASLVLPLFAIAQVAKRPDLPYRYPFIFRLL
jgi:hypothetical protein